MKLVNHFLYDDIYKEVYLSILKQTFQYKEAFTFLSNINAHSGNANIYNGNNGNKGNNGNNGNGNGKESMDDLFAEWEEWRDKNPWTDWVNWHKWDKIKDHVQYTNVYSLEGNMEYTLYISDEYINQIDAGGKILYLHSSLPRVRTTAPLFIMRRTLYEMR